MSGEYQEIECPKCKKVWMHKGKNQYAQCPNCKKSFKKNSNSKPQGELNRGSGRASQPRDASEK